LDLMPSPAATRFICNCRYGFEQRRVPSLPDFHATSMIVAPPRGGLRLFWSHQSRAIKAATLPHCPHLHRFSSCFLWSSSSSSLSSRTVLPSSSPIWSAPRWTPPPVIELLHWCTNLLHRPNLILTAQPQIHPAQVLG
jgi:hypothetical protein